MFASSSVELGDLLILLPIKMALSIVTITLLALPFVIFAQAQQGQDPYVPIQVNCTADVRVRNASSVSQ